MALAGLKDERALPSLLTALDTDTDTWRALDAVGHLPQCAAELTPRLVRRLADDDPSREWPDVSPTTLASALAKLGDPVAVPALAEAVQAAVRHKQWRTAEAVLTALASFGPRAASALDVVRPLTDADDVSLRTAAVDTVWELERRPESVMPLLQPLLDDHRSVPAIELAGRIGPGAAAVLPRLRQILSVLVEQNARNEQNGSAVLNDSWTLVHVASALWDIGGTGEADVVVPALLAAWKDNASTARHVVACLDRMGTAARPALPQIQAALAQPHRGDQMWSGAVAIDLEVEHTCRVVLARLTGHPDPAPVRGNRSRRAGVQGLQVRFGTRPTSRAFLRRKRAPHVHHGERQRPGFPPTGRGSREAVQHPGRSGLAGGGGREATRTLRCTIRAEPCSAERRDPVGGCVGDPFAVTTTP